MLKFERRVGINWFKIRQQSKGRLGQERFCKIIDNVLLVLRAGCDSCDDSRFILSQVPLCQEGLKVSHLLSKWKAKRQNINLAAWTAQWPHKHQQVKRLIFRSRQLHWMQFTFKIFRTWLVCEIVSVLGQKTRTLVNDVFCSWECVLASSKTEG